MAAKASNSKNVWKGPPAAFEKEVRQKEDAKRAEETAKEEKEIEKKRKEREEEERKWKEEEGSGVAEMLWDNALPISLGLVGVSFALHFWAKNK